MVRFQSDLDHAEATVKQQCKDKGITNGVDDLVTAAKAKVPFYSIVSANTVSRVVAGRTLYRLTNNETLVA